MKKILISIKPKWIAKILNGEETLEIRKSCPKCELPCEVYIYCTKGKKDELLAKGEIEGVFNYKTQTSNHNIKETRYFFGKDIPAQATEYIKNKYKGRYTNFLTMRSNGCNGLVVAKFTLNKVGNFDKKSFGTYEEPFTRNQKELLEKSCLTEKELDDYLKGKRGYAWHIDDIVIFDKPKGLEEFEFPNPSGIRYIGQRAIKGLPSKKRPPQSWCYCEVEE